MNNLLQNRNQPVEAIPFELGNTVQVIEKMQKSMSGMKGVPLDVVKMPLGGGLSFEIPTDNPNAPEIITEIRGIIIHCRPMKVYWKNGYTGENETPDCASVDGEIGIDLNGEERLCALCPQNKFGSSPKDNRGKACKDKIELHIILEGKALPIILRLPVGSIDNFKGYLAKRVIAQGFDLSQVVTKISLSKAQNRDGITYSRAVFTLEGSLETNVSEDLKESLMKLLVMTQRDEIAPAQIESAEQPA